MTIEPNELAAIKASVAAALVREFGGEGSPSVLKYAPIIDAIDQGAADAAAREVIMFDCETGDEILPSHAATGTTRQRMAAQLMPGWPEEEIARAYSAWMEDDMDPTKAGPFRVGSSVRLSFDSDPLRDIFRVGIVIKRVETDGELHTVWVQWSDWTAAVAYSPRELEEVK